MKSNAELHHAVWRRLCRLITHVRHPFLASRPALLLRYETPTQKAAYTGVYLTPKIDLTRSRRVLVIIPFRDKWPLTQQAIMSLMRQQLEGVTLLVALVDNGSLEADTRSGIADLLQRKIPHIRFRHLRYEIPFNFSRLNNLAAQACSDFAPDHLLFLNNDVEFTEPNAITTLCAFIEGNPRCGSVGCTLLYPDRRIQHLFIFVGCMIVGAHPFKGSRHDPTDPWFASPRPVAAATAALLLVRTSDYAAVHGFDEGLPSVQDVDLALKLQQRGLVNWVLPRVVAIHHETRSRSHSSDWNEVAEIYARWGGHLEHNPYIPNRFSRWSEPIALCLGEGAFPWWQLANRIPLGKRKLFKVPS
ncbi:MAG TPA: glycosyltransferase [Opitutaceae bacterium]|nr:glycosyltransferase [Opitutaceae bacterium]